MNKFRHLTVGGAVLLLLMISPRGVTVAPTGLVQSGPAKPNAAIPGRLDQNYGKLPLAFEVNRGQADAGVEFISRGSGSSLFLSSTEAVLVLTKPETRARPDELGLGKPERAQSENLTQTIVRMELVGANAESSVEGLEELPGKVNYFIGNDRTKWRTNVPTYARVEYRDVYPGVNLVYHGNQRQLEYDFVVRPGADPTRIVLGFAGADKVEVDPQGDLVLSTAHGAIRQRKPFIYQEVDGVRREIRGGYVIDDISRVGFQLAAYDASRPLVIDPTLVYSTYLGGGGDLGTSIAVDAAGNAYVTGITFSANFPTTAGAFQTSRQSTGTIDSFVTKLDPTGSSLVYSTYLGGNDDGRNDTTGIAVDAAGNAYVTGFTASGSFPTTPGAFQTSNQFPGRTDAFVTKLDPTGSSLVYSTYLGGADYEVSHGIKVDADGNAYVTGYTGGTDFPTTVGAFQPAVNGDSYGAAFVTKLNPAGSLLVYSTHVDGGTGQEVSNGIAIDAAGNAYITGSTDSTDFPTTAGAFAPTFNGTFNGVNPDAFVTKLDPTGAALVYSTYLGGTDYDSGLSIALDANGSAYVTGRTNSTDFPTTDEALRRDNAGYFDAFVTKLDPDGTALAYSTYLGGSTFDEGSAIAVDTTGHAYVTGITYSTTFPTTGEAIQTAYAGNGDGFVAKFNSTGSVLAFSTFLGGSDETMGSDRSNWGIGIAVDALADPNTYVTGLTVSPEFPTTPGAFSTTLTGFQNAFVAKIAGDIPNTPAGNNVIVQPVDHSTGTTPATLTFETVTEAGFTSLTTSGSGPAPPSGFQLGSPAIYYNLSTTATFTGLVSVCLMYDPAQFSDPDSLSLLHFQSNAWFDVTLTHDTSAHVICGQVSSFSPFVIAQRGTSLTSLGPTNIWVGLKNSDDVGIKFDLRAEVYRNGNQLVGSGEVASVAGGGSGFNNANQDTIALTPVQGVTFSPGDALSISLFVRNACTGSSKNSGTARLWFNDSAANSRFDATVGSPATYYLGNGFVLITAPGGGPKETIDVAAGAKCSPFKPFGTWSITLQ